MFDVGSERLSDCIDVVTEETLLVELFRLFVGGLLLFLLVLVDGCFFSIELDVNLGGLLFEDDEGVCSDNFNRF